MLNTFALSCGFDWCSIHPAHGIIWLIIVGTTLLFSIRKVHQNINTLGLNISLTLLVIVPLLVVGFIYYFPSNIAIGQSVSDIDPMLGSCPSRFCDFSSGLSRTLIFAAIFASYAIVATFIVARIYKSIAKNH